MTQLIWGIIGTPANRAISPMANSVSSVPTSRAGWLRNHRNVNGASAVSIT